MKTKIFQRTFLIAFLALAGCFPLVSLGVAMTLLWIPQSALGAWPGDPTVNMPICTVSDDQVFPKIISDGSGGAIITWTEMSRDQNINDIHAQRVDASGIVRWTENGLTICSVLKKQFYPTLFSDGSGGAIITWHDFRSLDATGIDIYAQRVFSDGSLSGPPHGERLNKPTNK